MIYLKSEGFKLGRLYGQRQSRDGELRGIGAFPVTDSKGRYVGNSFRDVICSTSGKKQVIP